MAPRVTPYRLDLHERKTRLGLRTSVCIPCRNEESTVGSIVETIVRELMNASFALVDELLVLDDGSTDTTARAAANAGATVVTVSDMLPERGESHGKGHALWASVLASHGDVIVWIDGDLSSFEPAYVERLVAPFLHDEAESVAMVKGYYERPVDSTGEGGGRVTELVARPLLALLFPEVAHIRQPLAGEYAIRRSVAEQLTFEPGYGVESGILIDVAQRTGVASIVQADLGVRRHRHRPLSELNAQSTQVMEAMLRRAGVKLPQ